MQSVMRSQAGVKSALRFAGNAEFHAVTTEELQNCYDAFMEGAHFRQRILMSEIDATTKDHLRKVRRLVHSLEFGWTRRTTTEELTH